jgi:hypothetical protein
MSLIIKKVNDNFYRFLIKKNDQTQLIKKKIESVKIPFGLEKYKGKYLVNFELSDKKDIELINLIELLETKIKEVFNDTSIQIKKLFKKTDRGVLVKGNIKKNKNVIITKYIVDNEEKSIFDLPKKTFVKLSIELSGIWKFKNTCGLFVNIKSIKNIKENK